MLKKLRGSIMLLIAAILWGTTFVAQSEGSRLIEPFAYNASRMFIGGIVLIPVLLIFSKFGREENRTREERNREVKTTVIGGICCGFILFAASSLQQIGIRYTTAGKSGFVTALYIIIVPFLELALLRKRVAKRIWLCVLMAIVGFYLLCITDKFTVSKGDVITLISAVFFACHIITIDRFIGKGINGVLLACIQFFVSGLLAFIVTLIFEHPQMSDVWAAKGAILYAGILSSGVAYTLQILGQRFTEPTVATLLMSTESVFAVLSGWLVLNERLSVKEGTGCMLVFAAVVFAQVNFTGKQNKEINIKEKKGVLTK